MFNTDGTFGAFSDLPYFGPVESMGFYDLVRSFRLHKLPTALMTNSRDPLFFAEPELSDQIAETVVYKNGKKKHTCNLPESCSEFNSMQYLFSEGGRSLISIRETKSRSHLVQKDETRITVDAHGANTLWSEMILYLLGAGSTTTFVIPNVDNYLRDSSGSCDYVLSLMLSGASCIAHHFALRPECAPRLHNMTIVLTLLKTASGLLCGDTLQCFLESKLKVAVNRVVADGTLDESAIELASESTVPAPDWLESVQNHLVEAHEDLCDERTSSKQYTRGAPVILVILPRDASVRQAVRNRLLDCYTSEPIRFVEDVELARESVTGSTPVIIACSTSWMSEQARLPRLTRSVDKLNIRQVLHTGFCEFGTNLIEERIHCFGTVLDLCRVPNLELHSIACELPTFSVVDTTVEKTKALESCSVLLLLFRRFLMKFSPSSLQPFTTLTRDIFLSERGWMHFTQTMEQMMLAGLVTSPNGIYSAEHIELTVLGRCLSFGFRMKKNVSQHTLSAVDIKTVLWAQLLRQPLDVVTSVIKDRYPFSSDVTELVETLLKSYKLRLDGDAVVIRTALIEQLAVFGFDSLETINRTHLFLSSPSGSRRPLQNHFTSPSPTVCRGWFKQAPLEGGTLLEKKPVSIFCLPPGSLYCEVNGAQKTAGSAVQCPVEISYPLIIAHSFLHIALHNNCVFVESLTTNEVVSLPTAVLQSTVLNTLLDHTESNNAGIWLDNCCTDVSLTPLDSSFLAPIALKGEQQIRVCERSSFQKKRKRVRQEVQVEQDETVFRGRRPRSQAEMDGITEFVEKVVSGMGKDVAEKRFIGKKGFGFIDPNHDLHAYYQHILRHGSA